MGLYGDPRQYWTSGYKEAYLEHNQYWGDEDVAQYLALKMGIPVPLKYNSYNLPSYTYERNVTDNKVTLPQSRSFY